MAAAVISEQTRSRPRSGRRGQPVPYEPSRPLVVGRLTRAVRRQWPTVLVCLILFSVAGIAFDAFGGVRPWVSALFWAPIAAAAGVAVAGARELSRNTVTSLSSLGRHQGYDVVGAAPDLTGRILHQLPPHRRTPMECVIFQPSTSFAGAFRDLQAALDGDRVVSFLGALPGEGASTAALCAAASAAMQGRRVILVDCDLRGRSLTRALVLEADQGIVEAMQTPGAWREMLAEEEETGFHFLPAARSNSAWRSLAGTPDFVDLVGELSEVYDLVILDCPPALATADGAMIAAAAKRSVLVTSWDRTPLQAVRAAMRAIRSARGAKTAIFVNRVPAGYRFGRFRPD
ncbi:MAG: AAA family ATPase [Hyphomonadaceae bacterium]|nr:AAA family ATPase [Hyphomonadaceae bacterium]